ncbi:hypothetical protein [Flaviflagellibacter deserti]|uniref:Uncharacterized protein n=1 Tax=Flaviflagellibacter deserti TaxID=2267266 RepID=A0ABV9YYT3_9HYPH
MKTVRILLAGLSLAAMSGMALAQSTPPAGTPQTSKPGVVAYPDNPAGTPAAESKGGPVQTDRAVCGATERCPDRPAPSGSASEGAVQPGGPKP